MGTAAVEVNVDVVLFPKLHRLAKRIVMSILQLKSS